MEELFSNETLFAERLAEMLSDAVAQSGGDRDIRLMVNGRELGCVTAKETNRMERETALRLGTK